MQVGSPFNAVFSFSATLTIQDRVAYISRAIMCAKNSLTVTSSNIEGEFLHELEDKLEVCRSGDISSHLLNEN